MRRVAYLLTPLAGSFALAEGSLRLWTSREDWLFAHELVAPGNLSTATDGGVRHDGPTEWHATLGPEGWREDHLIPTEAPPDTVRLVAAGDSWMYGFGVDIGRTLPDALEPLLAGKLGAAHVEIVNVGVPGATAVRMVARARDALQRYPDAIGVLLGQPHNPAPGGQAQAAPPGPPRSRLLLVLRYELLPHTWDHAPRSNLGAALTHEVTTLTAFASEQRSAGRAVWFIRFPEDRVTATRGLFGPEPEWDLGVPTGGSGLEDPACWSSHDPFHPSDAGYRAIAEAMVPVIVTGRSTEGWAPTPDGCEGQAAPPRSGAR
jgi:lysophospholipase L1-like esterase